MKSSPAPAVHILLVDDNPDGLIVRRNLLEEQGYQVQIACNGQEGLDLFGSVCFDVVVTDFRMPVMSGIDLIRGIRALKPLTPVILLSGMVEPLGLTDVSTGADAVIPKNSNEPANLMRWVKRLLNRASRKPAASQRSILARARA